MFQLQARNFSRQVLKTSFNECIAFTALKQSSKIKIAGKKR